MARFALFTNGVKVETLDELKQNFNIKDMLENYRNKALHRWLMINRMAGELSQVEAITAAEDNAVIDELVKIFGISAETIEEQKRVLEAETQKKEEVLSQLERDLLTDIEKNDFLKYMDDSSDPQNIIALLQKHAGRGNPVAQLKLGYCFENEKGVGKNAELAVELYKKSAEQGLARAQNSLGYSFQYGNGIAKDEAQAFFWYQKSADQDFHSGLSNLGYCYEFGIGVEKDPVEAVRLYKAAAELNDSNAEFRLGNCYCNGIGIEKDSEKAVFWYRKSAEHGNSSGQCNLGWCYDTGTGIEKNQAEAVKWYRKSAEQGDMVAQCNLGFLYENGQGVDKDLEQSKIWYRKSAAQGYARAKLNLISLTWDKDRIQLSSGLYGGLSNFICNESETYQKSVAGYWSSENKMIIALDVRGIYSSSDGLNWNQEFSDEYLTNCFDANESNGYLLEHSHLVNMRMKEKIIKDKYPDVVLDSCQRLKYCSVSDYIEHDDVHTFLLRWEENVGSTYYAKRAVVYGKSLNAPSSFMMKEIVPDNGYVPSHAVAWSDKFLFLEDQYDSKKNLTLNSRVSIVDTNYNRIQTVLQLKNSGWRIFAATPSLAIVFSNTYGSSSYYTKDGFTWNPLQWAIGDITYVYGIYWAISLPSNGKQHIIASYDGETWKDLGNISNFNGHFVIGNKKLFVWDGHIAFTAGLDFFDE